MSPVLVTPRRVADLFATTGFPPAEFRGLMRLPWTPAQQRRFGWLVTGSRSADRVIPRQARIGGYQVYLGDRRARARSGRRIVGVRSA
jgi:uncharacterized protein (DUF2236 family)